MKNIFRALVGTGINNKHDLLELLNDMVKNNVIEKESLPIIEAILQIDDLKAKDIMLPRNQIDFLDINDDIKTIIDKIVETRHSRFPVIDGELSNVIGIFHSKDLINYFIDEDDFILRDHLRQAYFVPEIKPLDSLMYEMRIRQTHLAVVVDEFTNIVGIITLEMIVEEIIGDIEDEHDMIDDERDLIEMAPNSYRVKGHATLNDINQAFDITLDDEQVETIGGYLIKTLGRIPVMGETFEFEDIGIEIVSADSRKIKLLIKK